MLTTKHLAARVAQPDTYSLDLGLPGVEAYIHVEDDTPSTSVRHNREFYSSHSFTNPEGEIAARVFGEGLVNRVAIWFDLELYWTTDDNGTRIAVERHGIIDKLGTSQDAPQLTRTALRSAVIRMAADWLRSHPIPVRAARESALVRQVEAAEKRGGDLLAQLVRAQRDELEARVLLDHWQRRTALVFRVHVGEANVRPVAEALAYSGTFEVMAYTPADAARKAFALAEQDRPRHEYEERVASVEIIDTAEGETEADLLDAVVEAGAEVSHADD